MSIDLELNLEVEEDRLELNSGFKRYVQNFADAWFRSPLRIAAAGLFVLFCLAVIAWNLQRLTILDEIVALEVVEFELEDELNQLELQLSSINLDRLTNEIEAENDRVFQGFPELAAWSEGLARVASSKGLTFSYQVEQAHYSPVPNILEVPLVLQFKALDDEADSLFMTTMELVGEVLSDHWHIDVVATQGIGDGKGLVQLVVRAHVWVRDRYGFVDPHTLEETS